MKYVHSFLRLFILLSFLAGGCARKQNVTNTTQTDVTQEKTLAQKYLSKDAPIAIALVIAFAYGILVSFTPCVYPLIPITASIIGAQAQAGIWVNFLRALSFILGTSFVYATLGYVVASTTIIFGQWVTNPFVTLFTTIFILYFALSLLGFYEIYIPSFFRRKETYKTGSLFYNFVAGLLAGTIASPCLSPALFTILLYAAQVGNPLYGFFVLFSFSLGIGLLLILVGMGTGSMAYLPKSGVWLEDVKRMLGFGMVGLAIYFFETYSPISGKINAIFPLTSILWAVLVAVIAGYVAKRVTR